MKRYLVFAGERYEPSGGAYDFAGSAETVDEAEALARSKVEGRIHWSHVFDLESGTIVVDFECKKNGVIRR